MTSPASYLTNNRVPAWVFLVGLLASLLVGGVVDHYAISTTTPSSSSMDDMGPGEGLHTGFVTDVRASGNQTLITIGNEVMGGTTMGGMNATVLRSYTDEGWGVVATHAKLAQEKVTIHYKIRGVEAWVHHIQPAMD